jgi:hypothetical protein
MNMKQLLISVFALFLICGCANLQSGSSQEEEVAQAVTILMKGIQNADGTILKDVAADELVYGHSSGKVQNKDEFIAEIVSKEPLIYSSIQLGDQTIKVVGETAIVRHVFTAETLSNGTAGNLKLGNVLIWQRQKGKWKLLARQAYR